MKKSIVLLSVVAAITGGTRSVASEIAADYVEGEKSAELVTPEIQAAASAMLGADAAQQLLHAMRLQMTKYDNDMRTQSGRRVWHGKLLRSEIHPDELCAVEVYTNEVDGAIWRYRLPFKSAARRTLPPPVMTNGIPAKLAAARIRRAAELNAASNVTVNIDANLPQ